jgi:hypothetical protein
MRNSRARIARRATARVAVVVEVVERAGRQTDRSTRAKERLNDSDSTRGSDRRETKRR